MAEHGIWAAVGLAFMGLLSTVLGFLISWIRDDHRHQWHRGDADRGDADRSARHLTIQDGAILDGAKAAEKAYDAANEVNLKIADLQRQIDELLKKRQ